jgi:hypothetical protein
VADEVISVRKDPALPQGWLWGVQNGRMGKVSTAYLDISDTLF